MGGGRLLPLSITTLLIILFATTFSFASVTVTKDWNDGLTGTNATNRAAPTVNITGEAAYEQLLNIFYPVGSCYISFDASFNPNTAWGGTWTKLDAGRFVQATTTASEVGQTVEAGLPNITGSWWTTWNTSVRGFHGLTANGAFYKYVDSSKPGRITSEDNYANNAGTNGNGYPWFDASRSNPIYGNSETVQPPAVKAFVWKRTA